MRVQYDPSAHEVLGVFGETISVKTIAWEDDADTEERDPIDCVVSMSIAEFHRVWDNWIKGKRSECEFYKMFCGVMGYTYAEDFYETPAVDVQFLEPDTAEGEWVWKPLRAFYVTKFEDYHDFERG